MVDSYNGFYVVIEVCTYCIKAVILFFFILCFKVEVSTVIVKDMFLSIADKEFS